jgi:hypothetical protein
MQYLCLGESPERKGIALAEVEISWAECPISMRFVVSNYNINGNSPALTFLGKGAVLSLQSAARHNGIVIFLAS